MNLAEILARYSHLRLATAADNDSILQFLLKVPMEAKSLSIRYDRSPDFFTLLKQQGDQYFVFLFCNDDGSIGGVSALSLRNYLVSGCKTRIGYFSDLRIHPQLCRKARVQWRKLYEDLINHYREIPEFADCSYMLTAVLAENEAAIRALAHGKSTFIYHEYQRYQAAHLVCLRPFGRRPKALCTLRSATESDSVRLRAFLQAQHSARALGDDFAASGPDELTRRLEEWEDFSIHKFILAEDSQGNLLGCVAPWSPHKARRLVVEQVAFSQRLLGLFASVLGSLPFHENKPYRVLTLTHLTVSTSLSAESHNHVLGSLLEVSFKMRKGYHAVAFLKIGLENRALEGLLKRYIVHNVPGILYQVMSQADVEANRYLPTAPLPYFELGVA